MGDYLFIVHADFIALDQSGGIERGYYSSKPDSYTKRDNLCSWYGEQSSRQQCR